MSRYEPDLFRRYGRGPWLKPTRTRTYVCFLLHRPGAHPYREFVNRWTTDGFRSYVGDLQSSVDRQLEASVSEQAREAEDAFFWMTHYEGGFWDMAMSG